MLAQNDSSVFQIETNIHVGKLIKIHGEYPTNDISTLIECGFNWKLQGSKSWHSAYKFPSCGFSLIHSQFGNQDILGQALAAIPHIRFERWKNQTRWSWRAGLGFAVFNKPYDAIENPQNLVIGSRITNMSMLRFELSKPLSVKLRYSVGISLTHCSDAHIAVPNIGANLVCLSAGISFCEKSQNIRTPDHEMDTTKAKTKWNAAGSVLFGIHEFSGTIRPVDGPRYFVYGENIELEKTLRPFRSISFGLNHYYYTAYRDYILSQELFPSGENNQWKSHTITTYAGYQWQYGRFALFLQAGINLYSPFIKRMNEVWDLPKHGSLYLFTSNKIGYKFYLIKQENSPFKYLPYITMAVKTNGGTADFLEFSFGIKTNRANRK